MVEMIKLEDGTYIPKERRDFTNPLTSGGSSEVEIASLPCGVGCEEECSSCIIQKIFNEYVKLTGQECERASKTRNITNERGFSINASDSGIFTVNIQNCKNLTVNIQSCEKFTANIQDCKDYSINKQDCKDVLEKGGE